MTTQAPPTQRPRTPEEWNAFMRAMESQAWLIGPMQDLQTIPEGFDVTATRVVIDIPGETYWVGRSKESGEERGLGKTAIERLAAAAGASVQVRRTDDRGHPRCCEFAATAVMRLLDGTPHYAEASRAYDMREDGTDWISTFEAAATKAYERALTDGKDDATANRIAQSAGHSAAVAALGAMHRNAETKARLRALRALLGIRAKYPRADLERKHFLVLKLSATGRTNDPQLRQEFARTLFHQGLGASAALFGASAPRSLPAPVEQPRAALPAPAGDPPTEDAGAETPEVALSTTPPSAPPQAPPPPSPPPAAEPQIPATAWLIPRGQPSAGLDMRSAPIEDVETYLSGLADRINAEGENMPKPHLEAANAKLARGLRVIDARKAAAVKSSPTASEDLPF